MRTVLHVLDGSIGEIELDALAGLLERLPAADYRPIVAATSAAPLARAAQRLNVTVRPAFTRFAVGLTSGPLLRRLVATERVDLVHTWGIDALAAAQPAARGRALVVSGITPARTETAARWLRQLIPPPAVVAGSQIVRSRLAQAGVRADRIVVIRGTVDFAAINAARLADIRERLVGSAGPVLLTPGPARRGDGQFEVLWAAAIVQQIYPGLRLILPFESPETDRARRMAQAARVPELLLTPGDRLRWAELAAAADVLVVGGDDETATEPIAWAMAAGLGIVGVAKRSITELIADRHNGLLCRESRPRLLAATTLRMLEDDALRRKLADTARGQAYEVFSRRAFLDNHAALYANTLAGGRVDANVRDTAMVA